MGGQKELSSSAEFVGELWLGEVATESRTGVISTLYSVCYTVPGKTELGSAEEQPNKG